MVDIYLLELVQNAREFSDVQELAVDIFTYKNLVPQIANECHKGLIGGLL